MWNPDLYCIIFYLCWSQSCRTSNVFTTVITYATFYIFYWPVNKDGCVMGLNSLIYSKCSRVCFCFFNTVLYFTIWRMCSTHSVWVICKKQNPAWLFFVVQWRFRLLFLEPAAFLVVWQTSFESKKGVKSSFWYDMEMCISAEEEDDSSEHIPSCWKCQSIY